MPWIVLDDVEALRRPSSRLSGNHPPKDTGLRFRRQNVAVAGDLLCDSRALIVIEEKQLVPEMHDFRNIHRATERAAELVLNVFRTRRGRAIGLEGIVVEEIVRVEDRIAVVLVQASVKCVAAGS